uniref:C2H2-type domain-containing protein n=1 Tax=Knipowitschia caucasica TaxID=637954 RepID=A0AAV2MDG9_KNICA
MHSLPHADPQTSAHTDSSESTEPASGDQEPAEGSSSAVTAGDTAHSADYAQISAAETDAYTGNAPKKHHSAPGERDCSNNTEKRSPSASDSDECTERLSPQKGNPTPKLDLGPTEERVSGEACSATTANKANEMEADRPESCEDEDTRQGDGAAAAEQKRQEEEEEEEEEAEAEAATKKRTMMCKECGKVFNRRETFNLHRHFHLHEDELKPLTCKECGLTFQQRSSFIKHRKEHKQKDMEGNMKTHQKLHQEKPFRCSSCHKGYSDQAQLDTHLLCHRGERPHRCNICDKAFGLAYQLLDHMNTHTGARPHRCEVCNKSFTWLSSLLVHKKAHKRQIQNTLEMEDSMSRTSKDKWAASSPFEGLGLVGLSDIPVSDAEMHKIVDQPPPISAASLEQTPQKMNELPPPVHWKADIGGELTAVLSPHKAFLALPTQPHSMPGKVLVSPHRMETSPSYISPGPSYVPQKTVATETEQQRQLQAVWSSPQSTVAPTSSLLSSHAVSYIDGAALWSVRPPAANLNLHNSPKKMNKDMQSPTWQGTLMPSQANLPSPLQKGELQKWDMASPQVQAIMQSEKAWVSGLSNASTLSQMPPHGIGARWDIQTSPGMQKALKSPDHLLSSPDFQLQQKQLLPFMSIPFEPQRFAQTISAPMWGFQSNPVAAQAILKAGNMQDLQQQNAKLIMNQPPHFFPPLQSLPPLGLPPSHPLHSVSVGVFPRPPHPNLFFPPQVSQVLSHKLGPPRLAFPTDRLPQCMICGRTLPREVDLQMHYMQHAQGEI